MYYLAVLAGHALVSKRILCTTIARKHKDFFIYYKNGPNHFSPGDASSRSAETTGSQIQSIRSMPDIFVKSTTRLLHELLVFPDATSAILVYATANSRRMRW